jgi:hypothetical protein
MEAFPVICDWQGSVNMAVSLGIVATLRAARAALDRAPFPERIKGKIKAIETMPGYLGDRATYLPYGTYNLTLVDPYGYDLLDGAGAARSASAAERIVYSQPLPVDGEITLTIASVATTDQLAGRGAFTGAATNWTLGSGWAYNSNNIYHNSNGTGTAADDLFAATAACIYEVGYAVSSWSVGTVTPSLGGATGTAVGANGAVTEVLTATSTAGLAFTPTNTARFTLDSVTVKYAYPRGRLIIWFE